MRPIAVDQNVVQYPLNELLATPANVRLMRVLADEALEPIGAADAAERAGLSPAGARRSLERLADTGFVRRIGGGHAKRYALRESGPVVSALRNLFRDENLRYLSLRTQIRKAIEQLPEIQAAWAGALPMGVGAPLQINLLTDARSSTYLGEQLRSRLAGIEREFDLIIEIALFTRADLPDNLPENVDLLAGYHDTGRRTSDTTHAERDARTARYSEEIAKMIDRDPSLIKRASRYLDFLLEDEQGAAAHDLREWKELLGTHSPQRLKEFLVADSPRAIRLRQSSPFFAVLSPAERDQLMDKGGDGNDA